MPRLLLIAVLLLCSSTVSAQIGPPVDQQEEQLVRYYGSLLHSIVRGRTRRIPFPRGSSGQATIRFKVAPNGRVLTSELAEHSGNPKVDEFALSLVPIGVRMPPFPPGVVRPFLSVNIPIRVHGRGRKSGAWR